jgi:hypothetical protein
MNTYEDDEFTRIEMESNARRLAVEYALQKLHEENVKLGLTIVHIPTISQEEWDALNAEEK